MPAQLPSGKRGREWLFCCAVVRAQSYRSCAGLGNNRWFCIGECHAWKIKGKSASESRGGEGGKCKAKDG